MKLLRLMFRANPLYIPLATIMLPNFGCMLMKKSVPKLSLILKMSSCWTMAIVVPSNASAADKSAIFSTLYKNHKICVLWIFKLKSSTDWTVIVMQSNVHKTGTEVLTSVLIKALFTLCLFSRTYCQCQTMCFKGVALKN